jgi:hypothetical protein
MEPLRIPKIVVYLTVFWGCVISAFFWSLGDFNPRFVFVWLLAVSIGFYFCEIDSDKFRSDIFKRLKYRFDANLPVDHEQAFYNEHQGVYSTLGSVPLHSHALAEVDALDWDLLARHLPKEMGADGLKFLRDYIQRNETASPGHVRLFLSLLRCLTHPDVIHFPAGFAGHHPGRSLLMHSLLVSYLCHRDADTFKPTLPFGLQPLVADFAINPADPLLPIVGLAHDIGKIKCFVFDNHGNVVGIKLNHDSVGARLVSLFPAYWDPQIGHEDRRILQTTLAYYHHPSEVPVDRIQGYNKQGAVKTTLKVTSDRLHAVLDLLIRADQIASSMEHGMTYSTASTKSEDAVVKAMAGNPDSLFASFLEYVKTKAPINDRTSGMRSTAFRFSDEVITQDKVYLYFDEKEFRRQFFAYMDKADIADLESTSNNLHSATKVVVDELEKRGLLARLKDEGIGKSNMLRAIYSVEFWDKRKPDAAAFKIGTCFVMDITELEGFEGIRAMKNSNSHPGEVRYRFGAAGANQRTDANADIVRQEMMGGPPRSVGVQIETVVKAPSKKMISTVRDEIKSFLKDSALSSMPPDIKQTIKVMGLNKAGDGLVVMGLEPALEWLGLNVETLASSYVSSASKMGFTQILPSQKTPGSWVFILNRNVFEAKTAGTPVVAPSQTPPQKPESAQSAD